MLVRLTKKYRLVYKQNGVENFAIGGGLRTDHCRSSTAPLAPPVGRGALTPPFTAPLCKSKGERIATAGVRAGFAMTPLTRGAV